MKAKIDLEKFICSLMERYYEKIHIDPTTTKCWLDSVLEDQGLEYKDGEIVEIEQEQPYNKPLFFEKGKWYTCIAKVDGFKVGHTYQSKMDGIVSNDSGAMYMYHNDANFIFRPATEEEIPHKLPSKPDYENLSIINEGDDGVLLYFTKDGRGISDFRISKDTARWLHNTLGEYLEEPQEQDGFEAELNALLKKYEHLPKEELADSLEFYLKVVHGEAITIPDNLVGTDMDGGVVGEKGEQGETLFKEQIENLKKRIEDNQLGCIVQRLDKIIELLQSAILVLPKEPYVPPIIYKRPLDPDPNVLGGWTTTASTFGSDYDIDTNKIKQNETSKPES